MRSSLISIRETIATLPIIGTAARSLYRAVVPPPPTLRYDTSPQYWDDRYSFGGNSGYGSYGRLAQFKAETINRFVAKHDVQSIVEFGCGDGAQLSLARYPYYTGIDVSARAIEMCRVKFISDPTKRFLHTFEVQTGAVRAELAMSLDVVYHLVEDALFESYMSGLVAAADRFICVYSSNVDKLAPESHIRHRRFTDWIDKFAQNWTIVDRTPNPFPEDPNRPEDTSWADFYFFVHNA